MKHLDVLITFVSQGLVKEHVEMIANMIDLDDEYKVSTSRWRIILSNNGLKFIGRAKRAPHLRVQSRFRVIYIHIYIYVCMYVYHMSKHSHAQSQF